MNSDLESQQKSLLAQLLSSNPLYSQYSEEAVLNTTEDILQESFCVLDVSGKEDDATLIVHYDFYKKDITGGNPFMYWQFCH